MSFSHLVIITRHRSRSFVPMPCSQSVSLSVSQSASQPVSQSPQSVSQRSQSAQSAQSISQSISQCSQSVPYIQIKYQLKVTDKISGDVKELIHDLLQPKPTERLTYLQIINRFEAWD